MATTIKLKNGSGAPLAGDLVQGEPALDLTNKRLYTEDSGGTVIEVGTNPTSLTTGTFTSTGIDDNATSTAITIDSDGDVGIGLASPLFQATDRTAVTINGTTSSNLVFGVGGSANTYFLADSAGFTIGNTSATLPTMFYTNSAERMRIDSSGNVGLGVTPSAWGSGEKAFQILGNTYGGGVFASGNNVGTIVGANAYWNGSGYKRINATSVSLIQFSGGATYFYRDGTGAADSSISLTASMTIDSSGRTLIGTTLADQDAKLTVVGSGAGGSSPATISANTVATFRRTGGLSHSANVSILGGSTGFSVLNLGDRDDEDVGRVYYDHTNNAMLFDTNAAERMRIDSSGNVGIGTTSPSGTRLNVHAAGGDQLRLVSTDGASPTSILMETNTGFAARTRIRNDSGDITFVTSNTSERMRIDSSGFVGIGTSSPDRYLHVNTSRSGDWLAEIHNTHTTNGYGLKVRAGDDANVTAMRVVDVSNNTLMEIQGGGNVGIGTTSPTAPLTVQANSSASAVQFFGRSSDNISTLGFIANNGVTSQGYVQGRSDSLRVWAASGDYLSLGAGDAERARIDSSGTVNIGTTSASGTNGNVGHGFTQNGRTISNCDADWNYEIYGAQGNRLRFFGSQGGGTQVGSVTVTTSATAYNTTSDQRLKENIVDAPAGNIDAIRVRSFDWKSDGSHQTYGMVAQELVEVAPEAVSQGETENDMWAVDYSKLVPMMIKEIQDLKAEVAALKGA